MAQVTGSVPECVAGPSKKGLGGTVRTLLDLIRFSHTFFALPWALAGLFIGARGWPDARVTFWVLVAMVGARSAAMAFNRLVDRSVDATNPRTQLRPSVTGEVGQEALVALVILAATVFVGAAYALNPLCGHLAWPTLAVLLGYSYTKRFTALSHFILGLALGLSPVGACLAVRGTFDAATAAAAAMGAAVLLWTAGFDILYSCQDLDHDRREGLFSVPARLGIRRALGIARLCHAAVPVALGAAAVLGGMGAIFVAGITLCAMLLLGEHRLVRPDDLGRVNVAFFQMNVAIAFVMMAATLLDLVRSAP